MDVVAVSRFREVGPQSFCGLAWDRRCCRGVSDGLRLRRRGAFYLSCCWETLAAIAACDHCFGVRPTIPSGGPPPRAPAGRGTFQHGRSVVRPKGCGSRLLPPPKRAPTLGNRDPNPTIGFLKSRCGFLWPELWRHCPFVRRIVFLVTRC